MSLQSLLEVSTPKKKIGISMERLEAIKPVLREYIALWREYPDLFVDFMQTGGDPEKEAELKFHLYYYQRVFLRIAMRYKYVYAVYPRAYSKSFLSVLVQMIRCILYPGANIFSTAGGKQQAAQILQEKVEDICTKIPAFRNEINWDRGREGSKISKDTVVYNFKNGSTLKNIAARESTRGLRFHAGLIEECIGVDQEMLQQVIIPTMNVSRRCLDGTVQEDEVLNQSQLFITTAGYKGTFSYQKLIQTLVQMIVEPEKAFVMGGTYRIPIAMGLQPKTFVADLKKDPTYSEDSFDREYCSHWTGAVEDAYFDGEKFDHNRLIQKPEYESSGRSSTQSFYIISVDVGRLNDPTVACVIKVTPQSMGPAIKSLVNIYTFEKMHFEDQCIKLKTLYYKYKAKRMVIDANGNGVGLVDYLVKTQRDETGFELPDFGVYKGTNTDIEEKYKQFKTSKTELDALYLVKANAPINTEAHANLQSQLNSGKIKFLINSNQAKAKLLGTVLGKNMTTDQRNEYLLPYSLTDILKIEMMNLREQNEGVNIILKKANKSIHKDKVSALEYGLYYIREEEENKRKRKHSFNAKDWVFLN